MRKCISTFVVIILISITVSGESTDNREKRLNIGFNGYYLILPTFLTIGYRFSERFDIREEIGLIGAGVSSEEGFFYLIHSSTQIRYHFLSDSPWDISLGLGPGVFLSPDKGPGYGVSGSFYVTYRLASFFSFGTSITYAKPLVGDYADRDFWISTVFDFYL